MSFSCSYCGGNYCSEHRLPENHDCDKLEEKLEQKNTEDSQGQDKWFENKDLKEETVNSPPQKPSLMQDIFRSLKSNITLLIIVVTVFAFLMQPFMPGISPPISQGEFNAIQETPTELNPFTLYPDIDYLLERPWTLATVMLMHGGFIHLFVNMITFYFFGPPLENAIGPKKLLKFYLAAGIVASVGAVAFQTLVGYLHGEGMIRPIVGASGAVVAIVGVIAKLYPKAEVLLYFFIPMKIKTAVYAFGGLELFNLTATLLGYQLPIIGAFASSAHLTGLLIGLWYGEKIKDKHNQNMVVFDPMRY